MVACSTLISRSNHACIIVLLMLLVALHSVSSFTVSSIKPWTIPSTRPSTSNPIQYTYSSSPFTNSKRSRFNRESPTLQDNKIKTYTDISPLEPPYALNQAQIVYVFMASVFITCLIIADIIGVKIFEIMLPFTVFGFKSIEHTCGMITFPLTFVISDTVNEYYGPRATKRIVYIGLWMSVLVYGVVNIAQALPYLNRPFNVTPAAFNMIFGNAKLLYIASLCAYLVGQLTDIWLFGLIKRWTKGKYLWLRAGVSTVVSQLLDSFMVSYFAFRLGKQLIHQTPATMKEIINISITGYGLKFVAAALVTPLMYVLRDLLQNKYHLKPLPPSYGLDPSER